MDNKEYPVLCMGTFLTLLFSARLQRTEVRTTDTGTNDGLSNTDLFFALLKAIDPGYMRPEKGSSFKVITSGIKNCSKNSSEYFNPSDFKYVLNKRLADDHSNLYQDVNDFCYSCLGEPAYDDTLISALIWLIQHDSYGNADDVFTIPPAEKIKRRDIVTLAEYPIDQAIVTILLYMFNSPVPNKAGRYTIEYWEKTYAKDERVLLESISKKVNLRSYKPTKKSEIGTSTISPITSHTRISDVSPETIARGKQFIEEFLAPSTDFNAKYFKKAYEKFSTIKTLLYNEQPKYLYDFFVCNDIQRKLPTFNGYTLDRICNATIPKMISSTRYIILSAPGGYGKSMMIRHLFLDAISNFKSYGIIPIMLLLKDYRVEYPCFEDYITDKLSPLFGNISKEEFRDKIASGNYCFLLDGLDEISTDKAYDFESKFIDFTDKYSHCSFIISSRPTEQFLHLSRFSVMQLMPFSLPQAMALIRKLDFRSDEPEIKNSFMRDLNDKLYTSHTSFASNPLLLTIMLLTYEQHGDIPSKMHAFYMRAYLTLAEKHDASKGGFRRHFSTGLTADQLLQYLSEFCARSYFKEMFDYTDAEFSKILNSLDVYKEDGKKFTTQDFANDLIANVCIMYHETGKYYFMHRSFQEFFCALFYSKQKDRTLRAIANSFEKRKSRAFHDQTFAMLYDLIPEKIEEYVFIPVLKEKLFVSDSSGDELEDYWKFLCDQYSSLPFEKGETFETAIVEPQSYLYRFIVSTKKIQGDMENQLDRFDYDEFLEESYCYYDSDYRIDYDEDGFVHIDPGDNSTLSNYDEVDEEYKDHFGDPDIVGWLYEINLRTVNSDKSHYTDLVAYLNDYDCPLRKEYLLAKAYLAELLSKYAATDTNKDDFDNMLL